GAFVTPVPVGHPDFANRGGQFLFLWDEQNLYIGLRGHGRRCYFMVIFRRPRRELRSQLIEMLRPEQRQTCSDRKSNTPQLANARGGRSEKSCSFQSAPTTTY